MFSKEQPDVVTEEDVGNYVKELHNTTIQPLDEVLEDDFEQLVRDSETTAIRSQN